MAIDAGKENVRGVILKITSALSKMTGPFGKLKSSMSFPNLHIFARMIDCYQYTELINSNVSRICNSFDAKIRPRCESTRPLFAYRPPPGQSTVLKSHTSFEMLLLEETLEPLFVVRRMFECRGSDGVGCFDTHLPSTTYILSQMPLYTHLKLSYLCENPRLAGVFLVLLVAVLV